MSVAGPSIGAMTLSLSHVHVFTDDPDAALVFYRDALGLEVRSEVPNEGFRWITLSTEEQPELEIVLSHPKAGRSEEDGETLSAMLAKASCLVSSSARATSTRSSRRCRRRAESRCCRSRPTSSGACVTPHSATRRATWFGSARRSRRPSTHGR